MYIYIIHIYIYYIYYYIYILYILYIILNHLPNDVKHNYRKLENEEKKLQSTKLHLYFNQICLKENLLPNYTDIYIYIYIYIYVKPLFLACLLLGELFYVEFSGRDYNKRLIVLQVDVFS